MSVLKTVLQVNRTPTLPTTTNDLVITLPRIDKTFEGLGEDYHSGSQTVTDAAEELIAYGDVATPGYILIINVGVTGANNVSIGLTGSYSVTVRPGEFAFFPVLGTLYAISSAAGSAKFTYQLFSA